MQSARTDKFRKAFELLPEPIKVKAREAYIFWRANPNHPSLAFKQITGVKDVYSIRIGLNYRAIGVKSNDTMVWFWIGSNEDYNNVIGQL